MIEECVNGNRGFLPSERSSLTLYDLIMKIFILMIFIIISCTSGEQKKVLSNKLDKELKNYESTDFDIKNIENNFIEKTTKPYNDLSKIDKSIVIPYDIISNVFLYPVNETIYEKSYLT